MNEASKSLASQGLGRRGPIRRLELHEEGNFPVATCLAESS